MYPISTCSLNMTTRISDPLAIVLNDALTRENGRLKRRIHQLEAQVARLNEQLGRREATSAAPEAGVFYVIQLDPQHTPQRVKLGWARDPYRRIAEHRCAAPAAVFLCFWPSLRSQEGAMIKQLTRKGCRPVSREVFDVDDLPTFCRQFDRKWHRFKWPLGDKRGDNSQSGGPRSVAEPIPR